LGGDFVVVPSPDHPELASGPDLLVGGRGRITAAFRVARYTSPRLLEARVIAARLAFPAASTLVAIVERGVEPPRHLAEQGFDAVIADRQTRDLISLCIQGLPNNNRLKEIRHVQQKHAILYSTILQIAELRQRHELKPTNAREVIASLKRSERPLDGPSRDDQPDVPWDRARRAGPQRWRQRSDAGSMRATLRQTTVAALPISPMGSISLGLRTLWSEALSKDFALDSGVPYQQDFMLRILLVEGWPTHRFDPRKPARVAAFSNWLMAIATTAEEIEMLADRSLEIVRKRYA
jgi:hypothetical protein